MNGFCLPIRHAAGLHARPASLFVQTASRYKSTIRVRNATTGSQWVNAKSTLLVLSLGVTANQEVEVQAQGDDAAEAVAALASLIEADFAVVR